MSAREAMAKVLRGNHGDATGTELGSSFIERITVNVGTVSILPIPACPARSVRVESTVG